MKKKRSKRLLFSRFTVIALAIVLQAAALWALFYELTSLWRWGTLATYVVSVALLVHIINKDSPAVYKLPWVIVCLLFPFAGAMCYLTFGNLRLGRRLRRKFTAVYCENTDERYDQERVVAELEEKEPQWSGIFKYLRGVTSLPAYDDSKAEYLVSGETYFEELLKSLRSAKEYIFLEYFIVEEGEMWNAVHEILVDKAKNGVKVCLVYDDVGSVTKVASGFYKKLRKEGIDARKFNKFIPVVSIIHNNRDHRKIAVIDGKTAFTGGVNIADEYINVTHPFGRWLDSGVKIEGRAVDSFVRLFTQIFNVSGMAQIKEEDYIRTDHEVYENRGFMMPFGDSPAPITYEHIAEMTFMNAIYGAKKSIFVGCPYLVADNGIRDALANAARRGVDVRLIIPQNPDKKTVYILTRHYASELMKAGVKIYFYRDGFIHSKTLVCDGTLAFCGTVNLDYRSMVHHFECGVVFTDPIALKRISDDFEYLFDNQCVVADKKSLRLKWYEKIAKVIMMPFAPLF